MTSTTRATHNVPQTSASGELWRGLWVVAYRESQRLFHDRSRMLSSIAMPVLFLIIFGAGFNRTIGGLAPGVDFIQFLFPGIIAQTVFMNSIFTGMSIVWDREFGFLRELLVAPISRTGIIAGKVVGGAGIALVQAGIILVLAPFVNASITVVTLLKLIPLLVIISLSISGLGILIATEMRSQQAFQGIAQLLIFPLIFISGVFFPINNVPVWLEVLSKLNPLTYGVDAVRHAFLDDAMPLGAPGGASPFGVNLFGHQMTLWEDAAVMAVTGLVLLALAVRSFNKRD